MKKYLLALVGTLLLSSPAFAAGYGTAGCGLGSLVFGDQKGLVQVLAATTNGTSWSQAFGISSGTSNCDAQAWASLEKDDVMFAHANFESLTKEMAVGEGEHVVTLAGMLGCPAAQFGEYAQGHYGEIFASDATTPSEMLSAVKGGIAANPGLAATCTN